ncbi:MAG: ABC transporter substrate-binding protein [Rubrivivax sp.]|nr:ABC transporter substrate-binding protein [Rubrivivax sp.]
MAQDPRRRAWLQAAAASGLMLPALAQPVRAAPGAAPAARVLRVSLQTAEAGFDPVRVGDESSFRVIAHILESPLSFDPLANPVTLVPRTAARMPEIDADFRHCVLTLKPGIFFGDDPVFQGRPRELTAADYVYTIKRFFDPVLRSEHLFIWESLKIVGMAALRQRALDGKKPLDYDTEVPGLRVIDRYRFELKLEQPAPRIAFNFTSPITCGAVAREVVEAYAADPMAHPVGTGPFRLAQWRRGSRIVLEKNPRFRREVFAGEPAEGDTQAQAIAKQLKGATAPLLDRIEIDIVLEDQPRWLAFLGGEHDLLRLPASFGAKALPGGKLAPYLVKQGLRVRRQAVPSIAHTFFNCTDKTVGGMAPGNVALRRAIALAYDSESEIALAYGGQATLAHSMIPPLCYGHEADLRGELGRARPARANALLDLHGYLDRNGDGLREHPDGRPLQLLISFPQDQRSRLISELWLRRLKAIGIDAKFEFQTFAELIRKSLAGQIMMWGFQWGASAPDGDQFLALAYGPNADQSNDARFALPEFDRLYEAQRVLPDGPERLALMRRATRTMLAWMPYIPHSYRIESDLMHPQVYGIVRQPFTSDWWRWTGVGDAAA